MSDHHCDECGEPATVDVWGSGCGNTACCFTVWDLPCDHRAVVCTCDDHAATLVERAEPWQAAEHRTTGCTLEWGHQGSCATPATAHT
jgi:hypothetical protein